MVIRQAEKGEYNLVSEHYRYCGYNGGLTEADLVVIACENQYIIAAVRICFENGEKVLRGMQVKPQYRNKGIGTEILQFLNERLDLLDCYCLPFTHLRNFYSQIEFEEIEISDTPFFLAERLKSYLESGDRSIIIMKRK